MATYTLEDEKKRKEAAGIPLNYGKTTPAVPAVPTAKPSVTPPVSPLNPAVQSEIQRKAGLGIALTNPTAEKQAIYDAAVSKKPPAVATGGFGATESQNEIQASIDALNAQLASAKSAADYGVGVNNQYLAEQLAGLKGAEAVALDQAQQTQNRFGGLYSGGLRYQSGAINSGYADARSGLTRDVAGRNQQLLSQYGNQANQIASQLQQLQSTAPKLIRDRILQYQMQTAPLTGTFQGQQTQDAINQQFNQDLANRQFDRGVLESDRSYNRGIVESDRNYALDKQQEARLSSSGGKSSSGGTEKPFKAPSVSTITGDVKKLFGKYNNDTKQYDFANPNAVVDYVVNLFPDDPQYDDDIERILNSFNITTGSPQQFGHTLR